MSDEVSVDAPLELPRGQLDYFIAIVAKWKGSLLSRNRTSLVLLLLIMNLIAIIAGGKNVLLPRSGLASLL